MVEYIKEKGTLTEFEDALKEYASLLGIEGESFNVASVLASLSDNVYFEDENTLNAIKDAYNTKNIDTFKVLLKSAIDIKNAQLTGQGAGNNLVQAAQTISDVTGQMFTVEQLKDIANAQSDSDSPLRFTESGEEVRQESFFENVAWDEIINLYATPNEITAFQKYLYDSGIVEQGYFAGTEGQQSEKLQNKITEVMNYIDNNIVTNAEVRDAIRKEKPVYFTSVQQREQDASFERNLFNYGLKEFIRTGQAEEDFQRGLQEKEIAQRYIPPSENELEDYTEAYFYAKIGRKPTSEELDVWATNLASSYSTEYAQSIAASRAFDDAKFVQDKMSSTDTISTATGPDLSKFSTQTQQEIFEEDFESQMQKEIDVFEAGQRKKDYQNQLLSVMFGGS